jgi:tetratricopeptide (TPR) repeat protein
MHEYAHDEGLATEDQEHTSVGSNERKPRTTRSALGWDWPSAEREFKRAIELNPNSAISHLGHSELLLARARFDESIAEAMRALELDPLSPQIVGNLAFAYLVMRCQPESKQRSDQVRVFSGAEQSTRRIGHTR